MSRKMTQSPLLHRLISTLFNVYYFTNADCVRQSWDSLRSEGNQNSGNRFSFMLSMIAQIGDYMCLNMKRFSTAGISTMVFVGPKAQVPFVYIVEGGAIHFGTWLSRPYLTPRAAFQLSYQIFSLAFYSSFRDACFPSNSLSSSTFSSQYAKEWKEKKMESGDGE